MTHLTEETAARREERRQRLAEQLRANLGRRKQQGRARQETGNDAAENLRAENLGAERPPQQSEGEPR